MSVALLAGRRSHMAGARPGLAEERAEDALAGPGGGRRAAVGGLLSVTAAGAGEREGARAQGVVPGGQRSRAPPRVRTRPLRPHSFGHPCGAAVRSRDPPGAPWAAGATPHPAHALPGRKRAPRTARGSCIPGPHAPSPRGPRRSPLWSYPWKPLSWRAEGISPPRPQR